MFRSSSLFQSQLLISRVSLRQGFCNSCVQCQKHTTTIRRKMKPNWWNFQEMGYVLLLAPAFTFYLGTWQVKRRKWKLDLIEEVEQKTLANAIDLPENWEDLDDLEFRRVRIRGKFDHSRELYMTPRSLVKPDTRGPTSTGLLSTGLSQPGAHVITAFRLADRDLEVMVNRGWVARKMVNPAKREAGQIADEVELVGVFRKSEKRQPFGAKNDPERQQWHARDQESMAVFLRTSPLFIEADAASTVPGGPVGGQTRLSLRNEHMSYIFTWYSLTAILMLMWYKRYARVRYMR